jgi:hypothetical protein
MRGIPTFLDRNGRGRFQNSLLDLMSNDFCRRLEHTCSEVFEVQRHCMSSPDGDGEAEVREIRLKFLDVKVKCLNAPEVLVLGAAFVRSGSSAVLSVVSGNLKRVAAFLALRGRWQKPAVCPKCLDSPPRGGEPSLFGECLEIDMLMVWMEHVV